MKKLRYHHLTLLLPLLGLLAAPLAEDDEGLLPSRPSLVRSEHSSSQATLVNPSEMASTMTRSLQPDISPLDPWLEPLTPSERKMIRAYQHRLTSENTDHLAWHCLHPHTRPALARAFRKTERRAAVLASPSILARQFFGRGRWRQTALSPAGDIQGRPMILTWSIVDDGTLVSLNSSPPDTPSDFRSWMASLYGGTSTGPAAEQPWFDEFERAFEDLAKECGLRLIYSPDDDGAAVHHSHPGAVGIRGDIRFAATAIDGDNNTLAIAFPPDVGDIILDSNDRFFNNTSQNSLRLHNTLTHEIGHTLGLAHVCPVNLTKLMEPIVTTVFRGPQFDDIYSLQRQYGDPLEVAEGRENNDSPAQATLLELDRSTTFTRKWLSIDGTSDIDFFRLPLAELEKLTIQITPSDPFDSPYLEGAQIGSNCTAGTAFDPQTQRNLSFELLATDGETVLTSASSQGLGLPESLHDFPIPDDGDYFLKVSGTGPDSAQLYQLQLTITPAPPSPRLQLISLTQTGESGENKNGWPDPGETIRLTMGFQNTGTLPAENLSLTVNGVPRLGLSDPSPSTAPGEIAWLDLLTRLDGSCGDSFPLSLIVTAGSYSKSFAATLRLGESGEPEAVEETFTNGIPTGWETETVGEVGPWNSDPLGGLSAPTAAAVSDSILISPPFRIGPEGAVLEVDHHFHFETTWDGGVLEYALDGGDWQDLPTQTEVLQGGYSRAMRATTSSSIANREAWTGDSEGEIQSSFSLPTSWQGQDIRFRWISAYDGGTVRTPWRITRVTFTTIIPRCETYSAEPNFAQWLARFSLSSGELDDDGDGLSNFFEFLLGRHPRQPDASFGIQLTDESLHLPLGSLPIRVEGRVIAESSPDLKTWNRGLTRTVQNGFELTRDGESQFLRLVAEESE